jgi:hypothetical protein
MGILGLLFRGTREVVQEQRAKKDLERKLGRKVSKDELYSLGSHLDAAQPAGGQQMPKISTPRESSVPFGDAKPPMKTLTKLLLIGIPLLLLLTIGAVGFVALMSQHDFDRLNPWTPKPPAGTFPSQLGAFNLKEKPDYNRVASYNPVENWEGTYTNGTNYISYKLWNYKSDEEVSAAFDARKKYITPTDKFKVLDDSASRYALVTSGGNQVYVLFKDGARIRQLGGSLQKPVYEVEGLMKNAPPLETVAINMSELSGSTNTGKTVTIQELLDEYKKDSAAADKKYKDQFIMIKGTVEVSDKDKQGKPMIGFLRPGSTQPKDGMVVCGFEKTEDSVFSKVKKGDTVLLQGKVFGSILGTVVLQNCKKY